MYVLSLVCSLSYRMFFAHMACVDEIGFWYCDYCLQLIIFIKDFFK